MKDSPWRRPLWLTQVQLTGIWFLPSGLLRFIAVLAVYDQNLSQKLLCCNLNSQTTITFLIFIVFTSR